MANNGMYYYDYYHYERVPFQLQPNTLPSLRELFFNTELSMPEFAGFVSYLFQVEIIYKYHKNK